MESGLDERYRLLLVDHYLASAKEGDLENGDKWVLVFPFCGPLERTEGRKKHLKGPLIWVAIQHSWVFFCIMKGNPECRNGKTFGNLISASILPLERHIKRIAGIQVQRRGCPLQVDPDGAPDHLCQLRAL